MRPAFIAALMSSGAPHAGGVSANQFIESEHPVPTTRFAQRSFAHVDSMVLFFVDGQRGLSGELKFAGGWRG
ncbi:MAG: hypothetical protein C0478_19050 [Planctomyces sp.]|nr:hypothetical protein [Planctomyces sp.]